jgi:hypothetical protein
VCVFGSFTTAVSVTMLLPFLPIFVEELGIKRQASIVQWSGLASVKNVRLASHLPSCSLPSLNLIVFSHLGECLD